MKIKGSRLAVAAVAVAAFGAASAASLGGLNSAQVGADNTVVASCDTNGVDLAYDTSYDATTGSYRVTQATISNINVNCNGQTVDLTLSGALGASINEGTATVVAGSAVVPVTAPAKAVVGAAIVISTT